MKLMPKGGLLIILVGVVAGTLVGKVIATDAPAMLPIFGKHARCSECGYRFAELATYTRQDGTQFTVYHPGWDVNLSVPNDDGRPVFAIADGVVVDAETNPPDEWGSLVIEHTVNDQLFYSQYGHCQQVFVQTGELVKRGKRVALVGGVPNYAPHLHWEIRMPWPTHPDPTDRNYFSSSYLAILSNVTTSYRDPEPFVAQLNTEYRHVTALNGRNPHGLSNTPLTEYGNYSSIDWWFGYNPNDLYNNTDGTARNCYLARLYGGSNGDGAIVYDALGGARHAYSVGGTTWDMWLYMKDICDNPCPTADCGNGQSGIDGGPRSALGMPITNLYQLTTGQWRQDFQKGYVLDGEINCYTAPGWIANSWNSQYSYLFADTYDRNGAARDVGEAFANAVPGSPAEVHEWQFTNRLGESDTVWIQNFHEGSNGEGAIMYDPDNGIYNPLTTNEAYYIYDDFWWRYILTDNPDNGQNGVAGWGFVTRDRYQWPEGSDTWRTDFVFPGQGSLDVRGHYMLLDPNDTENPYSISWHCLGSEVVMQYPAGPPDVLTLQPNEVTTCWVDFRNSNTNEYWDNIPGSQHYIELRSVNQTWNGDQPSELAYSWLDGSDYRIATSQGQVDPGSIGRYSFQIMAPSTQGAYDLRMRLHHEIGGFIHDDNAEVTIRVQVGQAGWHATTPQSDCLGPSDISGHKWFQTDYIALSNDWAPVALPDAGWGCNNCDRFYRLWHQYDGTESGQGTSIHFSSDDAIAIWVNGVPLGSWGRGCHTSGCVNGSGCAINYSAPDIDITSYLHEGLNLIAAHVSDRDGGERFNMQFTSESLNITEDAICCLGDDQCQEITSLYPSSSCIADGGTVYLGDWFDCGTFSSCSNTQTKGRGDPTLLFQGPIPIPQATDSAIYELIDTLPRSAWYDLPEMLGGYRLYVSDFAGSFAVSLEPSSDPDTLEVTITDYTFECPSVELGLVQTGVNFVQLDTSAITAEHGTYCISTGMVDVTVRTVILNDLYPQSNPIRSRSQIRGHLDSETGVLVVGSESYNVLPGATMVPGDMDANGICDIVDVIYLLDYMFLGGPVPLPVVEVGDCNCDDSVDISDLVYLARYYFQSGPLPCSHF